MRDSNWDLINGPVAHEIETLNYSSQVNFIECLVKFVMHHVQSNTNLSAWHPSEAQLKEFHRLGTMLLLKEPGAYRTVPVFIGLPDGTVTYEPPAWEDVQRYMEEFVATLSEMWITSSPIEIAAFCLWKINWVHPFKNGNGRAARAFAYACLCLKYGFWLPGEPTVIDQIISDPQPYQQALSQVDAVFSASGIADLSPMIVLLERLLATQLQSILPRPD